MVYDERFKVRNEEIEEKLRDIGIMLADKMPEGWGFSLLIFSFGEEGSTFYIANANRDDMIKAIENDFLPMLKEEKRRKDIIS